MRTLSACLSWLLLLAGCAVVPPAAPPAPTMMQFPPTWTPEPTATRPPPTATATRVIQAAPASARANAAPARRYPVPAANGPGAWADTTYLSPEQGEALAQRVQWASGPLAAEVRRFNPRVITLARVELAKPGEDAVSQAQAAVHISDGLVLTVPNAKAAAAFDLAPLRAALPGRLLIVDSRVISGTGELRLPEGADGVCLCSFMRTTATPPDEFKSESEWKQEVDRLIALSHIRGGLVLVATPFGKPREDEDVNMQQWYDYSLASYLLGADGAYTYYSFQGPRADDFMWRSPAVDLGYALGSYYQTYGMYVRRFQKGWALVNPGELVREMPLARLHVTPAGQLVTRARLEPHTGLLLLAQ